MTNDTKTFKNDKGMHYILIEGHLLSKKHFAA